jgi:hypothetical protein
MEGATGTAIRIAGSEAAARRRRDPHALVDRRLMNCQSGATGGLSARANPGAGKLPLAPTRPRLTDHQDRPDRRAGGRGEQGVNLGGFGKTSPGGALTRPGGAKKIDGGEGREAWSTPWKGAATG